MIRYLVLPLFLGVALAAPAPAAESMKPAARDSAAGPVSTVPDFTLYQSLLNEYLVTVSRKGEPLDTRFDYEKLYDARSRRARMVRTLDQLLSVPPSRMTKPDRLAWAINTYNFLVLDITTENLLVPDRKRLRHKSVEEIRIKGMPFFKAPAVTIEGRSYSLDDFERTFVFGGYRPVLGTPTPDTLDPRPHFALVCGAIGCPPLQPRAFRGDSLERQLDQATRNALRMPRHLRFNRELKLVEASEIMNWYAGDFGWHDRSLEFVKRYAPDAIQSEIRRHKLTRIGAFMPWDWMLNQVERKPAGSSS